MAGDSFCDEGRTEGGVSRAEDGDFEIFDSKLPALAAELFTFGTGRLEYRFVCRGVVAGVMCPLLASLGFTKASGMGGSGILFFLLTAIELGGLVPGVSNVLGACECSPDRIVETESRNCC